MEIEEMLNNYRNSMELKDAFMKGHRFGSKHANWTEKRNKTLETLLMEMSGHEKEWLITNAGYKKLNKSDLIQIIMEQRQLMKMLFDNLNEDKKEEFKHIVNKVIWENDEEELKHYIESKK